MTRPRARCHADIAREWRESMHARSWTDEVFLAAYAVEPMAFCRGCHAPRSRGAGEPGAFARAEGVSCAVCHVRDGHVLGPGRRAAPGGHASDAVLAMRTSAFCEGCHQFNFPADPGRGGDVFATDEPMQDTHGEWAVSSAARDGEQCQGCHMPWVEGEGGRRHRSHRFPGGGDRALLADAVRVEGEARAEGGDTVVRVAVLPNRIGHSFPTGDLFRRAELRVWADGDERGAQVVAMAREFGPSLERGPHGDVVFVRRQTGDTRVPPPGTGPVAPSVLRFPNAPARVRWRLDHLLMPTPMAASQGLGEPRVRTTIAEGLWETAAGGHR